MEQDRQLQCRLRGMLSTLDTGIIFAYLALMLAIGLYASRGQNTIKDYFVAGGKLGTFSIAFLWLASWVGGAAIVGVASGLMAWQMRDIVGILLVAFTINTAALFVPTIAIVSSRRVNTAAAFWSITLALLTVIGWYVASAIDLAPVFSIDPLWPGLLVSIAVFTGLGLVTDARK